MKLRWRSQEGLTLIEIAITIVVAGLIAVGVIVALNQIAQSSRNSEHMSVLRQIQNAGYWINLDAIQAVSVSTGDSQGFPLTMTRVDSSNVTHRVVYSLVSMASQPSSQLVREEWHDGGFYGTTTVAQYIDPAGTSCVWNYTSKVLTCTITAQIKDKVETRTYEVKPRPFT
jgi:type II secretory pathway pseudopilin PulG